MSAQGPWQDFSSDSLRRLPSEAAKWTKALGRVRARLPSVATIAVKGVGEVEIWPDQVAFVEEGVAVDGMSWFPLESGGRRAWVGVDQRIALTLVVGVLGSSVPLVVRPLGPAERGLMAAILLSALDAWGVSQGFQLGLGSGNGKPDPAHYRFAIGGSIRTASGLAGRVLLMIPVQWLAEAANTGPVMGRLDGLAAGANLELGRTALSGAEVVSAVAGDAVVFEGIPGVEPDGPWPTWLRVGSLAAPARLGPNGALSLVGPFSQAEEESMASQDEKPQWIRVEPASLEAASVVASAPVEVVAEIGRVTLRGDELAGLMKGGVLSLGSRPTDAIQLRVGGQLWAAGELVTMGDELGVRILKLHAG